MRHELSYCLRPREMRDRQGRASKGDPDVRRAKRARRLIRAQGAPQLNKLIERGLNGDSCGGQLAWMVAAVAKDVDHKLHPVLRRALHAIDRHDSRILKRMDMLRAVGYAVGFHDRWIRKPADWTPDPAKKEHGQLASFLRHLLCRYPVPVPFNWAWFNDFGPENDYCARARGWYVHLGGGGNLRRAQALPYTLTRAAAHAAMHAPEHLTLPEALRYGQFIAHNVSEPLARAAVRTQLGRANANNDIALVVARFLELNTELRPQHVQQVVDYVIGRRRGHEHIPPEPAFTLARCTAGGIMREIQRWHDEVNRPRVAPAIAWPSCGIEGFEQIVMHEQGELARWFIVELTSSALLAEEGRAMRHCVATYGPSAASRNCAIFALRHDDGGGTVQHVATIEVALPVREIRQLQGRCNQQVRAPAMEVIKCWATLRGVSL